jgi:hypothetical protein
METVCFSETLASIDESTRRINPEHHHPHRRENLRSHKADSRLLRLCGGDSSSSSDGSGSR